MLGELQLMFVLSSRASRGISICRERDTSQRDMPWTGKPDGGKGVGWDILILLRYIQNCQHYEFLITRKHGRVPRQTARMLEDANNFLAVSEAPRTCCAKTTECLSWPTEHHAPTNPEHICILMLHLVTCTEVTHMKVTEIC